MSYTATYQDCGQASTRAANGFPMTGNLFSSCTTQEILIINPATGLPLAEELRYVGLPSGQHWAAPDGLFSYEIFGQSHWTNDNPPRGAIHVEELGPPLSTAEPESGTVREQLRRVHGRRDGHPDPDPERVLRHTGCRGDRDRRVTGGAS